MDDPTTDHVLSGRTCMCRSNHARSSTCFDCSMPANWTEACRGILWHRWSPNLAVAGYCHSGCTVQHAHACLAAASSQRQLPFLHQCFHPTYPDVPCLPVCCCCAAMSNLCRDESCMILEDKIESVFGSCFSTHGLGGVLTCGVIGMSAGLSHSPVENVSNPCC
jgi:hypothetical protein